jgi:hypothetical protein
VFHDHSLSAETGTASAATQWLEDRMRRSPRRGQAAIAAIAVLSGACQDAPQEPKAAPATRPAPATTTALSDEARIRAALEPLAPESRRCRDLLLALNAALAAQKNEAKAANEFHACQAPVNEKTVAVMQALKKEGLTEERVQTVVNQWRNEQMSDRAPSGKP